MNRGFSLFNRCTELWVSGEQSGSRRARFLSYSWRALTNIGPPNTPPVCHHHTNTYIRQITGRKTHSSLILSLCMHLSSCSFSVLPALSRQLRLIGPRRLLIVSLAEPGITHLVSGHPTPTANVKHTTYLRQPTTRHSSRPCPKAQMRFMFNSLHQML